MAFKIGSLTKAPFVVGDVVVIIRDDKGKEERQVFKGHFSTGAKLGELAESLEDIHKILVGWSDVVDDDGQEIPFSKERLEEYANYGPFVVAVFEGWRNTFKSAKAKN